MRVALRPAKGRDLRRRLRVPTAVVADVEFRRRRDARDSRPNGEIHAQYRDVFSFRFIGIVADGYYELTDADKTNKKFKQNYICMSRDELRSMAQHLSNYITRYCVAKKLYCQIEIFVSFKIIGFA